MKASCISFFSFSAVGLHAVEILGWYFRAPLFCLGETSLTNADGVKSSALLTHIAGLEINCGDSRKKNCGLLSELLNRWLKKSP